MCEEHSHLEETKKLYQKAVEDFGITREKNDCTTHKEELRRDC